MSRRWIGASENRPDRNSTFIDPEGNASPVQIAIMLTPLMTELRRAKHGVIDIFGHEIATINEGDVEELVAGSEGEGTLILIISATPA
jgi:hypothetical protein